MSATTMDMDTEVSAPDAPSPQQIDLWRNKSKELAANPSTKPIFQHELSDEEWRLVASYAHKFNEEYEQRAQLILKRLDVTVESFSWSDRLKSKKNEIENAYGNMKSRLRPPLPVTVEDLIVANSDLLSVEKASCKRVRQLTCNAFNAYTVTDKPLDRGGRTAEMVAPPPDAPYWQKQKQGGGGGNGREFRGDSNRGRGRQFFQQYQGQRNDHIENQVRQNFSNDRGGGGRGGGRGRGQNRGGGGRGWQPRGGAI